MGSRFDSDSANARDHVHAELMARIAVGTLEPAWWIRIRVVEEFVKRHRFARLLKAGLEYLPCAV
jgi:hypothetical protein